MPGAVGLDAVEQPHRAPGRAWGDLEFSVEPPGVVALGVGGVLAEPGGLPHAFGEVFREVADVTASLLGARLRVFGEVPDALRSASVCQSLADCLR